MAEPIDPADFEMDVSGHPELEAYVAKVQAKQKAIAEKVRTQAETEKQVASINAKIPDPPSNPSPGAPSGATLPEATPPASTPSSTAIVASITQKTDQATSQQPHATKGQSDDRAVNLLGFIASYVAAIADKLDAKTDTAPISPSAPGGRTSEPDQSGVSAKSPEHRRAEFWDSIGFPQVSSWQRHADTEEGAKKAEYFQTIEPYKNSWPGDGASNLDVMRELTRAIESLKNSIDGMEKTQGGKPGRSASGVQPPMTGSPGTSRSGAVPRGQPGQWMNSIRMVLGA